jgi:hypothetical protein
VPEFTKVLIVTISLVGQKGMKGVVKVIVPLGVKAISAKLMGTNYPGVIERTFREKMDMSVKLARPLMDGHSQLLEEWLSGKVQNGMDCIDSKRVNMKFRGPVERIFDEKTPNLIAIRSIEVDGRAPGSLVAVREVRTEISQVVPLWP